MASAKSGMRMSAEERRKAVVVAAVHEFARAGLDGTSTETVAERAGISQPYLFRLFPGKRALFAAAVERCFSLVESTFSRVAQGLDGDDALAAMGEAYAGLLADRDLLSLQLHAYAAGGDPEVGPAVRRCFRHLWEAVAEASGADPTRLREFFATGMLVNVLAALDLPNLDPELAQSCLPANDDNR
ncbi:MAG: TetR/AcrR family transcriptional regulator [Acidimicrobiales bacterium]